MADSQCTVVYSASLATATVTDFDVTTRTITQPAGAAFTTVAVPTSSCACLLGLLCPPGSCTPYTSYRTDPVVVPATTSFDVQSSPATTRVATITQLVPMSLNCPSGVSSTPTLPTDVLTTLPANGTLFSSRSRRQTTSGFSTSVFIVTVGGQPMTSSSVVAVMQDVTGSGNSGTIGAIAGGAVGGLVLLFVLGGLAMLWYRGRQRRREEEADLVVGAGERIEDELWKPEKRVTRVLIPDGFGPTGKGGDGSDDDYGDLARTPSGRSDRTPALPNIAVPDDDDDEPDRRMAHTPSPHLAMYSSAAPPPQAAYPYGHPAGAYAAAPYPYVAPAAYPYGHPGPAPLYPPAYPPPSPNAYENAIAFENVRRASMRQSMYVSTAPPLNRSQTSISSTSNSNSNPNSRPSPRTPEEGQFSSSSTTAVNKRKSIVQDDLHRRQRSGSARDPKSP